MAKNVSSNFAACKLAVVLPIVLFWLCTLVHGQNAGSDVHLYFFTNDGCAPCRQVEPGIEALKREGYPVSTIKGDQNPAWFQRFQISRTPTVVLLKDNRVVGRRTGLIDAVTLKKWFAAVGMAAGEKFKDQNGKPLAGGTKVVIESREPNRDSANGTFTRMSRNQSGADAEFSSPTMHKGTRQPKGLAEQRAMNATVKLRVEDPAGISYATGTVIHSHANEALVLTCGHVFRDAKGKGEITAEYGPQRSRQQGKGELIYYDADARDIALVAIHTNTEIEPVQIAQATATISKGDTVFSIGCDHGEPATIRRTQIKNRAAYDGAIKYDIYGRPVDGRSGGGLFTAHGELIGVCNAAAVEVDEGIYAALDTVYWQLETANLRHLFDGKGGSSVSNLASNSRSASSGVELRNQPQRDNRPDRFAMNAPMTRIKRPDRSTKGSVSGQSRIGPSGLAGTLGSRTPVSWNRKAIPGSNDSEVIIIVRSRSNPQVAETITITDPTPQLIDYLHSMNLASTQARRIDVASHRTKRSAVESHLPDHTGLKTLVRPGEQTFAVNRASNLTIGSERVSRWVEQR